MTVSDLECSATDHGGRITVLEATVNMLTKQAARLEDRLEDLEARSRWNKIRVLGVPKGMEGPRPTDLIC